MQRMRTPEQPFKGNCEECGFDLSDSEDWMDYDDLNYGGRWERNVSGWGK